MTRKPEKLGEVCTIERGGSPRPINDYITDSEDGINWIKIGDAQEGSKYITSTKEKIKPEGVKKSRFVHKGDFILSNSMSFGRPYILKVDGCIHDGWLVIHDNNDIFIKDYLYYLLANPTMYAKFSQLAVGGVVNNLNSSLVRKVEITIPPKSTQLAIVTELDKINELIRLKKEQLKDFDNLAQSLFYEMFGDPVENEKGWEVKKLGDVCTFSQGMQVPIENQKEIQTEGDVRFLRIIDFTQGKDAPRYVECDNDKYILHEKEIAIVRYGTPGFICTGKIGAIANNLFKLNPVSGNIFVFEYLVHWLSTDAFQLSIKGKQYGAALQAIKFSTIQNIEIILPPLPLQRLFAQRIEQIEREKSEVQKSIQDLETLLASRMQYWFE